MRRRPRSASKHTRTEKSGWTSVARAWRPGMNSTSRCVAAACSVLHSKSTAFWQKLTLQCQRHMICHTMRQICNCNVGTKLNQPLCLQGKKQGGTKAPTIKTFDANRSYVQRATTEQFVGNYKKKPAK